MQETNKGDDLESFAWCTGQMTTFAKHKGSKMNKKIDKSRKTKLHEWSLWLAENCQLGPKMLGLASEIQTFHIVTSLIQFSLNFFITTVLPLSFLVFFIYLNTFLIKRKIKYISLHLQIHTHIPTLMFPHFLIYSLLSFYSIEVSICGNKQ